jgi:DNA-binding beta-propeller fold protein YncE
MNHSKNIKFGLLLSAALLLSSAGCSTPKQALIPMFWPDPPEKTRVKYVRSFRSAEDLNPPSKIMDVIVGKAAIAGLRQPMGLDVSEDGQRLYVTDFAESKVFVFDYKNRLVKTIGRADPLRMPISVALDRRENVYVSDTGSKAVKVFEKSGNFLKAIGKDILIRPTGLAMDKKRGLLYVVDTGHNDAKGGHQIKVFDMDGKHIRTIGKRGGAEGEFNFPVQATVDSEGRLYVADAANGRIQVFDSDGKFIFKFGKAGDKVGNFARLKDVALDTFGNIYAVDSHFSIVTMFNPKGETLMHFGGVGEYPGLLFNPTSIAIDKANRIYISNYLNRRVDMYQLVNTTAEDSWIEPAAGEKMAVNTK